MEIKVLGTGCAKCNKLYDRVSEIVESENLDANIEKVSEMKDILSYGVMSVPALVIDGEVKVTGSIPSKRKIKKLLLK